MSEKSTASRLKKFFLYIFSCCDNSPPTLEIGLPTDFRREDISLPGLTETELAFIREKARADAQLMVNAQSTTLSYPAPPDFRVASDSPVSEQHRRKVISWRQHARKLSSKMGYGGGPVDKHDDGAVEQQGGVAKLPSFAARSRDSITLHGGSDHSLHLDDMDAPPKLV